jgi:hypothetical protein
MNSQQAKEILELYRTGVTDENDPEWVSALEQAKRDPELGGWFEAQRTFNDSIRSKLRQIKPPADLRDRILANRARAKVIVVWWRRPEILAAAAALVILVSLAAFWLSTPGTSNLDAYQIRMAKAALRPYNMDVVTNDLDQIRAYLAKNGAPGDYVLSEGLMKLPGVGCARLKWNNQPVSMVCFQLGKHDLLWLFVVNNTALRNSPISARPELHSVGKLMTATWRRDGNTYFMGAIGNQELIRKFL